MKFWNKNDTAFVIGVVIGVLFAAAAVAAFCGGFSILKESARYATVLRLIRSEYIGEADLGEVTDEALYGGVASLDRWSYYMDAETYEWYREYSENRYQGIGVTVSKDEETGGFLIDAITKDGPAQMAGLVPGDIIIAVDGTDVTQGDMDVLRECIRAAFGRNAMVTVLHEDGAEETFAVSCEEVYSSPVEYGMLDGDIGYVVIGNFRQGAGADSVAAVRELIEDGARALIFDVRQNPGGQISELTELLDFLLPEGDIFILTDKKGREEITVSDAACVELPMAVLVDGDSYSAAEYFAAALQEYECAEIVGEPTTGKARSQVSIVLPDGSAVHISKYSYLTPHGNDLYEAGGLVPDIEVELTDEEREQLETGWLEPEDDRQVQAAVDALAPLL